MGKNNLFTKIELTKIKSNVFDLSHDVKLSLKFGDLVPIMCTECVPGDKFSLSCESLLRFAPLVSPVMHRMDVTMHYFFVPNRLVWSSWENFITGGVNGTDAPAVPFVNVGTAGITHTALMDYFGIPSPAQAGGGSIEKLNAIPFAAYQLICNEYYRDQNLVGVFPFDLVDGANNSPTGLYEMRKRAWPHDYFTSALPFAQRGATVNIPLLTGGDVPVLVNDAAVTAGDSATVIAGTDQPSATPNTYTINDGTPVGTNVDVFARTSTLTTSSTISDLRRAFKLQEFLERAARGGSRYIEFIKSMFGVSSSDKRLQRPEYITGVKSPVVISEVLNTSATATQAQGNMAGHGVSVTSGQYGSYYVEEHGYIIGIMSVLPQTAYQQGIPKHFTKHVDRYQYYFEQFAHIGEQAIQNREIYAFQGAAGDNTFGYIPRYAEYKFENNRVAGDFRDTLDFWHLGRIFGSAPGLNQTFIECVPDTRIFAVEDGTDYLWAHVYNKVKAVRKMAYYGSPHF
jgi:hypothetical protein